MRNPKDVDNLAVIYSILVENYGLIVPNTRFFYSTPPPSHAAEAMPPALSKSFMDESFSCKLQAGSAQMRHA